jgi:hypothetical protein
MSAGSVLHPSRSIAFVEQKTNQAKTMSEVGENQAHGLPLDCFKSTPTPYHMLLLAQLRLGEGVTLPCHSNAFVPQIGPLAPFLA